MRSFDGIGKALDSGRQAENAAAHDYCWWIDANVFWPRTVHALRKQFQVSVATRRSEGFTHLVAEYLGDHGKGEHPRRATTANGVARVMLLQDREDDLGRPVAILLYSGFGFIRKVMIPFQTLEEVGQFLDELERCKLIRRIGRCSIRAAREQRVVIANDLTTHREIALRESPDPLLSATGRDAESGRELIDFGLVLKCCGLALAGSVAVAAIYWVVSALLGPSFEDDWAWAAVVAAAAPWPASFIKVYGPWKDLCKLRFRDVIGNVSEPFAGRKCPHA